MRATLTSVLAAAMALGPVLVSARPVNEIETIYYATKARKSGEEVGKTILHCSGPFEREGKTSPFYVRYTYPCNQLAACSTESKEVACSVDLCDRMKAPERCKGTSAK